MARTSLRDRFFTRSVSEALTSPSGILLAGAGTAAGVALGLPVLAAVAIGAVAWGGRVAVAIPRSTATPRADPLSVKEPWRRYVWEATKDQHRFERAIRQIQEGPLRTRMEGIGARLEDAVAESYRVARSGQDLEAARSAVDVAGARRDLERLGGAEAVRRHPPDSHLGRTAAALQAQIDTASRLDATIAELHDRLSLLDARLGEAVSRAIELSVRSGSESVSGLGGLDADVGSLVGELEALRQALDETSPGSLAAGRTPPPLPRPDAPRREERPDPPRRDERPAPPPGYRGTRATSPPEDPGGRATPGDA